MCNLIGNNKELWSNLCPLEEAALQQNLLDGKIYVFGGQVAKGSITNAESYDPVADKWSSRPNVKINQ